MVGLNYDGSKTSFSMLQCYKLTSLNLDCRNISVHTLVGFLKPFFFKEDLKPYSPGPTSLSGAIWDATQYPGYARGDDTHIPHEISWKHIPCCNGSWRPGWAHWHGIRNVYVGKWIELPGLQTDISLNFTEQKLPFQLQIIFNRNDSSPKLCEEGFVTCRIHQASAFKCVLGSNQWISLSGFFDFSVSF